MLLLGHCSPKKCISEEFDRQLLPFYKLSISGVVKGIHLYEYKHNYDIYFTTNDSIYLDGKNRVKFFFDLTKEYRCLFDYVQKNDTIIKVENSFDFIIKRNNLIKKFTLECKPRCTYNNIFNISYEESIKYYCIGTTRFWK